MTLSGSGDSGPTFRHADPSYVPIIHTFLIPPARATSRLYPGDKALCGHVKTTHNQSVHGQPCMMCWLLDQEDAS